MGFGSLGKLLGGRSAKTEQLPALTPEQQNILNQILGMLDVEGMDIGNSELFGAGQDQLLKMLEGDTSLIEAPLMQQFEQEIMPGIAQRFGGLGAKSSSGYQQAMANAGGNLAAQLGQLRYGAKESALDRALAYSSQRAQGLQSLANLGLGTKSFGYQTTPGSPGLLEGMLSGAAGMAGQRLAMPRRFGGFF